MAQVCERLDIVVADLAEMRRYREWAAVEIVEAIAVVRRPGDRLHRHPARVAGPVLEDERLAEQRLERPGQRPCASFRRTARRVADHQADRLARISLGVRRG